MQKFKGPALTLLRSLRRTSVTRGPERDHLERSMSRHVTSSRGQTASGTLWRFGGRAPSGALDRAFSNAAAEEHAVVVPDMGDSITEGSIAEILKKAGDFVEMDEVIAQVETDKVTIDIRAPSAGTISALMVSVGDTVLVGQKVVSMGGAGNAAPAAAAPVAAAAPAPPVAAQPAGPTSATLGRHPSIKFPPRRTAAGVAISSLPAAEAAQELASVMRSSGLAPPSKATQLAKPAVEAVSYGDHPVRLGLSQEEIDAVELGGMVV
ncbi:hypothetical protein CYMTET_41688 [Cymbomonas tetramitiformis]|uniref:Lipoyl-binding domain-containing protein n=1 Tax=Cymbomonas tetramitiformis TaxID=36881 RepID=A0AAE0F298_9CHLO|nr:hypothetical protein CYMTET_41688 [Cymbomonas tetramitiformis]